MRRSPAGQSEVPIRGGIREQSEGNQRAIRGADPRGKSEGNQRGHPQRPSVAISGHQRPSEAIRGHQRPSEAFRGHQRPSEAFRGLQRPSEAVRGRQRPSEAIRGHQRPSEATRGRQRPPEAIRRTSLAMTTPRWMNSATCSKSVGPKPREVRAGVPIRIPPGMKADLSPGTVFLLMAICERWLTHWLISSHRSQSDRNQIAIRSQSDRNQRPAPAPSHAS